MGIYDWLLGAQQEPAPAINDQPTWQSRGERLKRQQQVVDMLRKQSQQTQQGQMIGGGGGGGGGRWHSRPAIYAGGNTALSALGQAAMGYMANKNQQGIDQREAQLESDMGADWDKQLEAQYGQPQQPLPAGPSMTPEPAQTMPLPYAPPPQGQPMQGAPLDFPQGAEAGLPSAPRLLGKTLGVGSDQPDSAYTQVGMTPDEVARTEKLRGQGLTDAQVAEALNDATAASMPSMDAGMEAAAPETPDEMDANYLRERNADMLWAGKAMKNPLSRTLASKVWGEAANAPSEVYRSQTASRRGAEVALAQAEQAMRLAERKAELAGATPAELAKLKHDNAVELLRMKHDNAVELRGIPQARVPASGKPGSSGNVGGPLGGMDFSGVLDTVDSAITALEKSKGMTSEGNNVLDNIAAYVMSTEKGQEVGRAVGSRDQTQRDKIVQARPLMLRAVAQATGMSAKNLDSNAEMQLWLNAMINPKAGVAANREAFNNIKAFITIAKENPGLKEDEVAWLVNNPVTKPNAGGKKITKEVKLKDGRIGVIYEDGTRGYK